MNRIKLRRMCQNLNIIIQDNDIEVIVFGLIVIFIQ